MQLIAEAYDILHRGAGAELRYFDEGTRRAGQLSHRHHRGRFPPQGDELTGLVLVDLPPARRAQASGPARIRFNVGAPVPTINSAVVERIISSMKVRCAAAEVLPAPARATAATGRRSSTPYARRSTPARSAPMPRAWPCHSMASDANDYDLNLGEVAAIWRGGCIIRFASLNHHQTFNRNPPLASLLLDEQFARRTRSGCRRGRHVVQTAIGWASRCRLIQRQPGYYDSYRSRAGCPPT